MNDLSFKKLEKEDLSLMHSWLNSDHVKDWYGKENNYRDINEVIKKYIKIVNKEKPTKGYLIQSNNKSIGYIQTYYIYNYPDYNKFICVDRNTAGLDLFIGEFGFIHKGYGPKIIIEFLDRFIFSYPDIQYCIIGPEQINKIAIRAYEKVGFSYWKTIKISEEREPEYIMRIGRKGFYDKNFEKKYQN